MLSPVWTPIGSKFSIEHTTTQLSARSRITSSSNSFHPTRHSSIRMLPLGLAAIPKRAASRSCRMLCTSPEPWPPSVNEERMTSG
jgi:hypothetical protein